MKKLMMIAVMAIFAMTASAQNINREVGAFTLQPKVGLALGSFSGEYITTVGGDTKPKTRVGFIAGVEGEYYIAEWFGAALGLSYAQQGWKVEGVKDKLDYLNVPLVANFYVARGLALKTGVQLGFLMNAKEGERILRIFAIRQTSLSPSASHTRSATLSSTFVTTSLCQSVTRTLQITTSIAATWFSSLLVTSSSSNHSTFHKTNKPGGIFASRFFYAKRGTTLSHYHTITSGFLYVSVL
jgi:hypothetical protein